MGLAVVGAKDGAAVVGACVIGASVGNLEGSKVGDCVGCGIMNPLGQASHAKADVVP